MKKNITITSLFLLLCPSYSDSTFYAPDYTPLDNFKENNAFKTMWNNEWVGAEATADVMKLNAGIHFIPTPKGNFVKNGFTKGLQMNAKDAVKGVGNDIVNFRKGLMNPLQTGKSLATSTGKFMGKVTGKGAQLAGKGLEKIGAKSVGKGLQKIGSNIVTKVGARAGARAAGEAAAEVAVSTVGRGLAAATGVGTAVVLGITAIEGLQALGEGMAYAIEKKNCHKLCSARVVEYARQVGATGSIDWDDIEANVLGDTYGKDKRYCECQYKGTNSKLYDVRNQKFYLDQLAERGPLGKIYKQMCKEGRTGKKGLFGAGLINVMGPGDCDSEKTVCLRGAPRACVYAKADD